jgi:SAM-dependent methyltransferase
VTHAPADHADHAHDEHEARYAEGDAAAWDRPIRESELYLPDKRDVFNFIDETKVRHLRPLLPAEGICAEVGAGSGRLLIRVGMERAYRLVALDYAPYAIRAVRENYRRAGLLEAAEPGSPGTGARAHDAFGQGPRAHAAFGDVRALPFADGALSVVLSGGLLEHFRDPAPVIREMARVLRPGGLFYADIVPRKVSLYRWAERRRMERDEQLSQGIYESDLSKGAWARLAREAGLRDVRIVSAGVYPPYTMREHERLIWRYGRFLRALDGTPLADVLGFFYMATGRKA